MKLRHISVIAVLCLLAVAGCKKTPIDSTAASPELDGAFVGWGRPEGTGQNVELVFAQADSGNWSGQITYGGLITGVVVTEVSEDEDSVRFQYIRGTTPYRLVCVASSVAIQLYVLEPSGQPTYLLYYAHDERNLSGKWSGSMRSDYYDTVTYPTAYINQAGSIFSGDIESDYIFWHFTGDIDRGALQNDAFYFGGVSTGLEDGYAFRFDGEFTAPNTINGQWTIWGTDFNDNGTYTLSRDF
ncbi:MAG: hypothetical protein IPG71_13265 [bacterium]|nr:hypothetical protein [bacterium]